MWKGQAQSSFSKHCSNFKLEVVLTMLLFFLYYWHNLPKICQHCPWNQSSNITDDDASIWTGCSLNRDRQTDLSPKWNCNTDYCQTIWEGSLIVTFPGILRTENTRIRLQSGMLTITAWIYRDLGLELHWVFHLIGITASFIFLKLYFVVINMERKENWEFLLKSNSVFWPKMKFSILSAIFRNR